MVSLRPSVGRAIAGFGVALALSGCAGSTQTTLSGSNVLGSVQQAASGALQTVKDTVELGKQGVETVKKDVQAVKERAEKLGQGVKAIGEGLKLMNEAVAGASSSKSSN